MTSTVKETVVLPVLGMTCASCQHHVERALRSTSGVSEARVDLMAHRATVVYDPEQAAPQTLVEAIKSAGYDAVLPRRGEAAELPSPESESGPSRTKAQITIAAGVVAMFFAMPLNTETGPIDRAIMAWAPWLMAVPADAIRWTLLIATTILVLWAGLGIYVSAARVLRHGTTNMNTLVSLGTGVAFFYSAFATIFPAEGRQVYYDAVLLILGFLLLGKSLEAGAKRRSRAALDSLSRLQTATARRVVDDVESMVPLEEIRVGDTVLVLPGERFPVDATILDGQTTVDESMLTGESTPLAREPGDRVLAGSLNYDGAVTCTAQSLGQDTVLSQITRLVEQAQSSRAPMERLADQASAIFVPTVLALATITFGIWALFTHSLQLSLASSVAVLVIACPCAMGLAVPAALTVAVGRGAQLGVLFKGGEALERLAKVDTVVLDKTGTLTLGKPVLVALQPMVGYKEMDLLRIAAAVEERSNHPIAHAIVEAARARGLVWHAAEDVQILPGRGVTAKAEDADCVIGNEVLFREMFARVPDNFAPARAGSTRLYMALNGLPVACFDARDTLRPDASQSVHALRNDGLRVLMLTGDTALASASIANQVGIVEMEASVDPAGKLEKVRKLQAEGHKVAMVGDGINDAGALAQADAGIALGTGADLAQEAGDVLLLRSQPSLIPGSIELARATVHIMRENLVWAACYNLLGIPLAAGLLYPFFHILLSPWLAAAAMAASSISVLANSLRLRRWRPGSISVPASR